MKSNSFTNPRIAVVAACGIGLALGFFATPARADMWNKMTILTTNEPIQITDKLLQPGKYTLKLMDSDSNRNIVAIYSGDQTREQAKYVGTVLAIPAWRLQVTGDTQFTYWETPAGAVKALRRWYYPGDNAGQEFPYPKQLAMLNTVPAAPTASAPAPAPTPEPQAAVEPPVPDTSSSAAVQSDTMTSTTTNNDEQQAATMNQDQQPQQTPTTPAPTTTPDNSSSSADRAANLPATSSPYTLIGLLGLLSLAGFGAMRLKGAAER